MPRSKDGFAVMTFSVREYSVVIFIVDAASLRFGNYEDLSTMVHA